MNYSKNEAIKKQKHLVSKSSKNTQKVKVSFFKVFLVCIVSILAIGVGAGFGMMNGILDNAPNIDDINVIPEGFQTCIYNQDGELITTLSTINSNREYAYYKDIPEDLVNAYIAIEDQRFRQHNGVDIQGILRAAVEGIKNGFHFDQ
ncbi:MAG: transglycosylase domain-containing protein, partial [Clostridium sp.]|nr:transglycosylase domain-containing protein [Clostridium sp.]